MEISHSTLPGHGKVHHCRTRDGQSFGVMADRADHRRLLIYGPADLDTPIQTIVLDEDEADLVADLLHSRSVNDRLAVLERRFTEITGELS